ncbi:cytidine deaminase [Hyphopichia burtonii NRRL Y-1933]|uniref:Cytidine deaminase n=1 Tax=Hyphopichia burtonii NRRL Y-1933 TaxID=984485 RepID=A0A1E4RL35_9ASCO|nr:cytidine deaminase [Hyphopichia burtonii NRRL Y-1933]ODV67979.1 cytidine deaminase [Hyphopichia burtonii NRRL Y-1933]
MTLSYIHRDHHELSDAEFVRLKHECLKARDVSYSPYSKFRVGCCIITSTNEFISGANVENASYGAGVCAERTTICKAVLQGYKTYKAIAISSDSNQPISPCGICRQFIREFAPNIPVFMFDSNGDQYIKCYLEDLLPLSFGPENLGIDPRLV